MDGVQVAHPGKRAAGGDIGRTDGAVRGISPPGGFRDQHCHHGRGVAGAGADFDIAAAHIFDKGQKAANRFGVVGERGDHHGFGSGVEPFHIVFVGRLAVLCLPLPSNARQSAHAADVLFFLKPHELPRLFDGHGNFKSGKHLHEHVGRAHAAVVDGRAGPVEHHGLHRTSVG